VLAAVGSERLLNRAPKTSYLVGWAIAAAVVGVLALAGFFSGIGSAFVPEGRQAALNANAAAVTVGAWRSFFFVALAVAGVYALYRGKLRPDIAGAVLATVVLLDLWSVVRLYWGFSPRAAVLYASDATIEYVKSQPQPGRVLPVPTGASEVAYHDPMISGDGLMVHRVRNALGYHGNHIARYGLLGSDDQRLWLSPRFWQLANVKYLLTNEPTLEKQGFKKLVGPAKNAAGTTVFLYELPGENPLAWVTPAIVKAGDEQVFGTLYHERYDPRTAALFDTSAAVQVTSNLQRPPEPLSIQVSVKTFEPGHIALELSAPAPAGAALVVSENYYPGWKATADGRAATTGRADLSLIGVELPAGARQVDLTFSSHPYEAGRAVTIASVLLSLLILGAGVVAGKRQGGSPAAA
jgi:hypothetical protein